MTQIEQNKVKIFNLIEFTPKKFIKLVSLIVGIVFLICVLVLVLFPDPFINQFLKKRITNSFAKAYPGYSLFLGEMSYSVWNNDLECDSIALKAKDSSFTCSVNSFSISGISWLKILAESDFNPEVISNSKINTKKIILNFNKLHYKLSLKNFHISLPDSEMNADSIKYNPLTNDGQFFAGDKFRQTRFRFDISKIKITGLDFLGLIKGNIYKAKNINIQNMFADVLVNKDKPYDTTSSNPLMPNEAFSLIKVAISLDSLIIRNGTFNYHERFTSNAKPGLITFNKIDLFVSGISNNTETPVTTTIHSKSLFMNLSKMELSMKIPLMSKDFSLKYSGTFSPMDATELNAFVEPSEHQRIKSGTLQSANYNININSGIASGKLDIKYKDLSVAILNEQTGSENGFLDRISTFIGKVFVIRRNNMPDKNGSIKIGEIKYIRNQSDYFMQFIWFALRSGLGDVVGF